MQALEVLHFETVQLTTSLTLEDKSCNSCYHSAADVSLPAYVAVSETDFWSKSEPLAVTVHIAD